MPESVLDVFDGDAFSTISLTTAIRHVPYAPSIIGASGLFQIESVADNFVMVEEKEGLINIIPTSRRGSPGTPAGRSVRKGRIIELPHLKLSDEILASDLQGKRIFGQTGVQSGDAAVAAKVNEVLATHRQCHEVTLEYHRMGALNGLIMDADGSAVLDLFDKFGVTEQTVDFDFTTTTTKIRTVIMDAKRKARRALGGTAISGFRAICGERWWDAFIDHANVTAAFARWQDGRQAQDDLTAGFRFAGVEFFEYSGMISGPVLDGTEKRFIAADAARLYPVGSPGLFKVHFGPADYIETVNTYGMEFYAKQERMEFNRGIKLESQSNPLHICHKPASLVKLTKS